MDFANGPTAIFYHDVIEVPTDHDECLLMTVCLHCAFIPYRTTVYNITTHSWRLEEGWLGITV